MSDKVRSVRAAVAVVSLPTPGLSDLPVEPSVEPIAPYVSTPPGTIKVSSPKGTRTWTASELTDSGVPDAAHRAYLNAAKVMAETDPACQLPWTLLAAIGRVESDHGRYGGSVLGSDGVSHPLIIGVALNGVGPVAAIRDSDDGLLDKDTVWDRAVGPMQFIPTTWAGAAKDGDGDGVMTPNDIDDAALAAAAYLCSGTGSVLGKAAMRAAIYRYNPSEQYVVLVMALEVGYRTGDFVIPTTSVVTDGSTASARPHTKKAARKNPSSGSTPHPGKQPPSSGSTPNSTPSGGSSPTTPPPSGGTTTPPGDGDTPDPSTPPPSTPPPSSPPPSTPPPPPPPSPTDPPPPPDPPEKTFVGLAGAFASCASGWCVNGTALDLGPQSQLGATAVHDFDGDGSAETNQLEFDGMVAAGASVNLLVDMVNGTAVVYQINGVDYRFADGSFAG